MIRVVLTDMGRPCKPRRCACPQRASFNATFKPAGSTLSELSAISLAHDELEAFFLCDGCGKTQAEAGLCMEISRGTVQRLLASGRKKIALALVHNSALMIGSDESSG
jgi:predicted DNA-binding protein (UPF0251 family)